MLLAVDPGIRGCGVAVFCGQDLVEAAYVRSVARHGDRALEAAAMARTVRAWFGIRELDAIAVEWPKVYASRIRTGEMGGKDPNSLLALCGVDAALAVAFNVDNVFSYLPSEWKGQMTKAACHHRIQSRLSDAELRVWFEAEARHGSLVHNVWDAVGIGLHHRGRLKPRRVIPV